jgi:hypothetical protein
MFTITDEDTYNAYGCDIAYTYDFCASVLIRISKLYLNIAHDAESEMVAYSQTDTLLDVLKLLAERQERSEVEDDELLDLHTAIRTIEEQRADMELNPMNQSEWHAASLKIIEACVSTSDKLTGEA